MRRRRLRDAGLGTDELDREIIEVRRQLREGGRLRAGDALDDGRYLLVREVGKGGFAVVWDAYDRMEQQHVAIKVLHANLAGDLLRRERFFRGAQAMRDLPHPAVVRVIEPEGEDGGFHYFVMELLTGGNLHQAVLANRVTNERALPLLLRVIEAVARAHASGMIHRDIKPENILLDGEGNPKLTDFDLVGTADTTGGTHTGAMGTVVYAAPECLHKPQEATARADVYGLGMTALFCLSRQELSLSVFRDPAPLIAWLGCSDRVREVLRRAVAWEPGSRFADAAALGHALGEALSEDAAVSLPPRPSVPPAGSPMAAAVASEGRSRRWAILAGGGAVAALMLGVVAYILIRGSRLAATQGPIDATGPTPTQPPLDAAVPGETQPGGVGPKECLDGMVRVPAGTFQMGSPEGNGYDDDHRQHAVTLSGYCIDKTEVTVKAYSACVAAKKCEATDSSPGGSCNGSGRPEHPINCVDWNQAVAYCRWAGKRLPTEAEWEYAARGSDGREYPWGNQKPSAKLLNACGTECFKSFQNIPGPAMYNASDNWKETAPVGSFPDGRSPFGALDMAGNVWEWVADRYGDYPSGAVPNPQDPEIGSSRVLRGGAWDSNNASYVRAANRDGHGASVCNYYVGFRCARGD